MPKTFSNRIAELRKQRGFTQEELGSRMEAELTGSTIAKLENGRQKLTVEYALEIATILGASLDEILGLEGEAQRIRNAQLRGALKTFESVSSTLTAVSKDIQSQSQAIKNLLSLEEPEVQEAE